MQPTASTRDGGKLVTRNRGKGICSQPLRLCRLFTGSSGRRAIDQTHPSFLSAVEIGGARAVLSPSPHTCTGAISPSLSI